MRIISDFKDYYDSVQYWNSNDERIWIRKNIEEEEDSIPKHRYHSVGMMGFGILGFCGKLYPYTIKHVQDQVGWLNNEYIHIPSHYIYDFFYDPTKDKKLRDSWEYERFVNTWNDLQKSNILKDIFLKREVPMFDIRFDSKNNNHGNPERAYFKINYLPILKDLGFYRVMDAYQTYQAIDMFFSNELVMVDNPIQIKDDIVLRDSKGFDKWSFKTMPTKRR